MHIDIDTDPNASLELLKHQVIERYSNDSDVAQLVTELESRIDFPIPCFPNPLQIGLGTGQVAISVFHSGRDGAHGLILKDTGVLHEIGSETKEPEEIGHIPVPGEVYIACLNRESALVLQDMVNRVVSAFAIEPRIEVISAE
jgi:hypothetical protein